ncbi:MAG: Hpt domain-containing protein, partial [Solirubrobacteraceae bacterium]
MDTSEYMPMFLAEAQEHLQELNLAVVSLEEDPSNTETVDGIFRIAHTIKGMSATMGFEAIAELTHVMEDVFELLRQREGGLSHEAITTVLACLDALEASFESIESTGQEHLSPEPLIEQLRSLIRVDDAEREQQAEAGQSSDAAREQQAEDLQGPDPAILAAAGADGPVLHIQVQLDEEVAMPAVRAHMVFAALNQLGEMVASRPSPDVVEHFHGTELEAWLRSDLEPVKVAQAATRISDVASVEIETLDTNSQTPPTLPSASEHALTSSDAADLTSGSQRPAQVKPDAKTSPPERGASDPAASTGTPNHASARTVRVDAERLDTLMHLMGELVIHRTAVEAHTAKIDSPELHSAMQNLTRSSQALQQMVMQVRMMPVDVVFMRFPRLVRDMSTKLGKHIELELVGRATELDRTVVDALGDPLVHLVRNSLDHGIESPQERLALGKPATGTLTIAARHAGDSVVIEVRDDGRGVDPARIASKAVERDMIDAAAAENMDMRTAIDLLFESGFSTAEVTTDLSGRGVGMDAVREKIRGLGGEVLMDSVTGQGTTAQIRLPLTLAIVSALQVGVDGAPFAIPIDRVERTMRLSEQTVRQISGRRLLSLSDGIIPLVEGSTAFGRPT